MRWTKRIFSATREYLRESVAEGQEQKIRF